MPIEGQDSKLTGRTFEQEPSSAVQQRLVDSFLELHKKGDVVPSTPNRSDANSIESISIPPIQSVIAESVEPAAVKTAKVVNPDTVLASAEAVRSATYRDAWFYSGTDEDKVFKVLSSMTEGERESLKTVYKDMYGITLEKELKRELSGSQLDKGMNLLNKKDGIADNAGFVHELVTELNQTIVGRSRSAIGRTLREKLSSMSSKEVDAMDRDYEKRYGISAKDALLKQGRLDTVTKDAFNVYFKGADKTTDDDALHLARTALKSHDLTMLRESMVLASPEARKQFDKEINGNDGLREAFLHDVAQMAKDIPIAILEGAWSFADRPQSVQNYMYAKDYVTYGKLSAITQITDSSGIVDDNESAIESALHTMSDQERALYRTGKSLSEGPQTLDLSVEQRQALSYHLDLNAAIEGAGNATESLRWQDMAVTKGGTFVSDLAKHRGMLYNDGAGKVISDIENMSKTDWNQLQKNPNEFSKEIEAMLKTIISQKDVDRAMDVVREKSSATSYEDSVKAGRRSVENSLRDSTGMWGTDGEAAIKALLNMTPEEQGRYRTNPLFQSSLDTQLYTGLVGGTPHHKAAKHILNEVKQGKAPSNDIIVKLYMYGSMFNSDDAEVLREVEKAFKDDPQMLARTKNPKTAEEKTFAKELKDGLVLALGPIDFGTYGIPLLEKGAVPVEYRTYLSQGYIYDERESMIKSILASNETDKQNLLSEDSSDWVAMRVQSNVFRRLTVDQKQFVQTLLKQGDLRPEDSIRSFVVGAGAKSSAVIDILTKLPAQEQARLRDDYASKYGANMVADLNYWLKPDEQAMLPGLVKTDGRTVSEVYNEELDQYSHSRDGLGQWFVDNEWDATGFQAEEAVGEYTRALALSAESGEELQASRQLEITQQIAQSLSNFRESKLAAGEAVANGTITGVAVVAAPFTAGTSLTLLAKVAIAGAAGAAIKVGTKAAISGSDYDFSAKRLTVDGGTGFISGAVSMLGTAELASLLGVGGKVGTQAASIATSSLVQIGKESGELLLKEGTEEVVKNCFVTLVRQAMVSGSDKVPEQALAVLAQQIATKGNEAVVELALKQSLNAAITEATANGLANISVQVGLPTANGAISGALSGTVTGAADWDSRLPVGKNVEHIAVSAGVNGTVGAGTAFTVAAGIKAYKVSTGSLKVKDQIPANANPSTVSELSPTTTPGADAKAATSLVAGDSKIRAIAGVTPVDTLDTPALKLQSVIDEVDNVETPVFPYKSLGENETPRDFLNTSWVNPAKVRRTSESGIDFSRTLLNADAGDFRGDFKPGLTHFAKAQQLDKPLNVSTTTQGVVAAQKGDFIVTTSQGKAVMTANEFNLRYELYPDDLSNESVSVFRKAEVVTIRPFRQSVDWHTASGRAVHSEPGDILMINAAGDYSATTPKIFTSKFESLNNAPDKFQRSSMITARKLANDTTIMTPKGPVNTTSGNYVVRGRNWENYVVPAKKFESMYTPVRSQTDAPLDFYQDLKIVRMDPTISQWSGNYNVKMADGSEELINPIAFRQSYRPVEGRPGEFRPAAAIMAQKVDEPMAIATQDELVARGKRGDYLLTDARGDKHFVSASDFAERYRNLDVKSDTESRIYKLSNDDTSLFRTLVTVARDPQHKTSEDEMKKLINLRLMTPDGTVDDLTESVLVEQIKKNRYHYDEILRGYEPELYDWLEWNY